MKFSLAFDIFNKEDCIESLLTSWVDSRSGLYPIEVIMVFDALRDQSGTIAKDVLARRNIPHVMMSANDMYEVFCNNLAFQHATGDFIVFIQDDNWMHDKNWDVTLAQVLERIPNIGVVGLLAGSDIQDDMHWQRIEAIRQHKRDYIASDVMNVELGVWAVDAVCRPFGLYVERLTQFRGLDLIYHPMDFDDMDVCMKSLRAGLTNICIPFDVVNTGGKFTTMDAETRNVNWSHGFARWRLTHGIYASTACAHTQPQMILPLVEKDGGLHIQ